MNLCLITAADYVAKNQVVLKGQRFKHIIEVLGCDEGDSFAAGLVDGKMGRAEIVAIGHDEMLCQVDLNSPPPAKLPLTLILALPRPKMLKRILRTVAELGVTRLVLLNTWKVEKSYWQTPFLADDIVTEQFMLGLEQAKDTVLPELIIAKRFKPFVEDELPSLIKNSKARIAHPGQGNSCPIATNEPTSLAIGPEGGFTDYEVDKLIAVGFEPFNMGNRILRVETAVTACIAKLFN